MTKLPDIHKLMQDIGLVDAGTNAKGVRTYEPRKGANAAPPLHRPLHNALKKAGYRQVPGTFPWRHRGKERFYTKGRHGVYVYSFHDDTEAGGGRERAQIVRHGSSNVAKW
jgi:hypothetical protein